MDKGVKPYPPQPLVSKWFVVLMVLMIAGCVGTPQVAHSVKSERFQVAKAALRHMMDEYHNGSYSAYVIDGGELTSQLVAALAGYKPEVVAYVHQLSAKTGPVIDKTTGKVVEFWQVSVESIEGDRAIANVGSEYGNIGGEWYRLQLVRKDGQWTVESEKLIGIS